MSDPGVRTFSRDFKLKAPASLDAVFVRQNYHDLYDKFMGPADVPEFNRQVYAALKPGEVYVILDHAAKPGGESKALASPADDHTKMVFDPAIRGKTDQFLLRFKMPK